MQAEAAQLDTHDSDQGAAGVDSASPQAIRSLVVGTEDIRVAKYSSCRYLLHTAWHGNATGWSSESPLEVFLPSLASTGTEGQFYSNVVASCRQS